VAESEREAMPSWRRMRVEVTEVSERMRRGRVRGEVAVSWASLLGHFVKSGDMRSYLI